MFFTWIKNKVLINTHVHFNSIISLLLIYELIFKKVLMKSLIIYWNSESLKPWKSLKSLSSALIQSHLLEWTHWWLCLALMVDHLGWHPFSPHLVWLEQCPGLIWGWHPHQLEKLDMTLRSLPHPQRGMPGLTSWSWTNWIERMARSVLRLQCPAFPPQFYWTLWWWWSWCLGFWMGVEPHCYQKTNIYMKLHFISAYTNLVETDFSKKCKFDLAHSWNYSIYSNTSHIIIHVN